MSLENNIQKIEKETPIKRRSFLKKIGLTLGAIVLAATVGCSPTKTTTPTQYTHQATVNAQILQNGITASGTATFVGVSTGKTYKAALGQAAALDTTTNQTEEYNITITGANTLERRINNVGITNTTINTNILDLTNANISDLLNYVLFGGVNAGWSPTTINVVINPDSDGTTLPQ